MRIIRPFLLVFTCLLAIAALLLRLPDSGGGKSGRTGEFVSARKFEQLERGTQEEDFDPSALLWEGGPVPCDAPSTTVFIPCDLQTVQGTGQTGNCKDLAAGLSGSEKNASVFLLTDDWTGVPEEAVRESHPFRAVLVSGKKRMSFQVVLTGLPAVCLHRTDQEEIVRKEVHEGRIRIITGAGSGTEKDPDDAGKEFRCTFHVRGNVSSTLDKKPYKISLVDERGEKTDASWLGLRRDDDWILNPLFTDSTRVREMTAYELWEETASCTPGPEASSHMKYTEVFLDNEYQGIYTLMEPLDRKQLGLKRGDILYKIDRWDWEYPYLDLYEEKEGEEVLEILNDHGLPCVEIRYPLAWDSTATWKPMEAFHSFCFRTKDPETLTDAGLSADLDSVVRMDLFCTLIHGMDNNWKNTFLIARKTPEGYSLYRTIWDMNYSFGDVFIYQPEENYVIFDPDTARSLKSREDSTFDYAAFLETDPELEDSLRKLWTSWRQAGISASSVCGMAERNREILESSGAMIREAERWPLETGGREEMEEMEEWIRRRFAFLDAYFNF